MDLASTLTSAVNMPSLEKAKQAQFDFKTKLNQADPNVEKTAKEFEAVFISQMLENMYSGVQPNEITGGGNAETTFRSMLFQEYGKGIANAGGIGIADNIKQEIIKLQEAKNA